MSISEVSRSSPVLACGCLDILTREARFVHESAASTLQPFHVLLAMIVTCDGVSFFGGAHGQPLTPRSARSRFARQAHVPRAHSRSPAGPPARPAIQLALFALWNAAVERMVNQPPPVLKNTDGDPMQLTSDEYGLVASREEVARALASVPGVEEPELGSGNTVFTVTKPGNKLNNSWDNTIVARIVLSARRMSVETNSVPRGWIAPSSTPAGRVGPVPPAQGREHGSSWMAAAMAVRARTRDARARPNAVNIVATSRSRGARVSRAAYEGVGRRVDPALDGMTPRAAARSPRVRSRLETLLKEFVQHEAPIPRRAIDLEWIREELGLA